MCEKVTRRLFNSSNKQTTKKHLDREKNVFIAGKKIECPSSPSTASDEVSEPPLFWWHPESAAAHSATWQSFILLVEALEEKQVNCVQTVCRPTVTLVWFA